MDLDLEQCLEGKQYHDGVGEYQRLNIPDLKVDKRRGEAVRMIEDGVEVDGEMKILTHVPRPWERIAHKGDKSSLFGKIECF